MTAPTPTAEPTSVTPNAAPTTATVQGRLWGARAADWARYQEPVHTPLYTAVLALGGVNTTSRYLDIGSGAGGALAKAAHLGASCTGLDAAEDLVAIARSRVPEAMLHVGEQETLPFADDSFDVVSGINAFQYAGNPTAALREAARVLAPEGRLIIATWGEPQGMPAAKLVAALKPLMPPPASVNGQAAPGPFALSNETALRDFATAAGLEPGAITDVDAPFTYASAEDAITGLCSAGVAVKAMEASSEQAVTRAYQEAVAEFIQADGSVHVPATFRCLTATLEG